MSAIVHETSEGRIDRWRVHVEASRSRIGVLNRSALSEVVVTHLLLPVMLIVPSRPARALHSYALFVSPRVSRSLVGPVRLG